ncbi:MAG: phosphate ABC transporter permease PstA [Clostridiales bacterium]|nr:phosphate ABC transporter permease PstA [Clostridiales bacterium]
MEFFRKAKRIFLVLRGGDLSERIQKNAAKPRGEIEYSVKGTIAVTGRYVSYAASAAGIFSLASIVVFVFINGVPHIDGQLLFGEFAFGGAPTIASSLLSTGMTIAAAAVLAFPLGIFTAIYLVEYTSKGNRLVKIIRPAVETLGGIPSIVYGLFGMILFCGIFKLGTSIIAGSLTISLMIIPTTVRAAEEALRAVPDTLREGSMALGGGRLRTIYRVVLPPALPGILAAVILGIGRIASESAPFLFTMGASLKPMPTGFKSAGTTLAVALYALSREGLYIKEAYATASVLILIILTLNVISTVLVNKLQKKLAGARREK